MSNVINSEAIVLSNSINCSFARVLDVTESLATDPLAGVNRVGVSLPTNIVQFLKCYIDIGIFVPFAPPTYPDIGLKGSIRYIVFGGPEAGEWAIDYDTTQFTQLYPTNTYLSIRDVDIRVSATRISDSAVIDEFPRLMCQPGEFIYRFWYDSTVPGNDLKGFTTSQINNSVATVSAVCNVLYKYTA